MADKILTVRANKFKPAWRHVYKKEFLDRTNLRFEPAIFGAQDFTLDNGLKVVVIPNHKAPVVKLMLWYKVGSVDEPLGKGGLAHLLEHLMFRGTKKVKGSSFNDIIEAHGGDSNAFTSHDFTVYHEFLDISRLEVALALEADRMQNLQINMQM